MAKRGWIEIDGPQTQAEWDRLKPAPAQKEDIYDRIYRLERRLNAIDSAMICIEGSPEALRYAALKAEIAALRG